MSASQQAYATLIAEIYETKVRGCPDCHGLKPECYCMKKFDKLCEVARANIPYKFRYARIEKFVEKGDLDEIKQVEKYIKHIDAMIQKGMGIWINGGPGSGKSLLICSILIGAIESGFSSYYLDVNEFYRLQELRYSDHSDIYQKKIGTLSSVDFLAIDGLGFGIQGGKQASKQALAYLFQQRINANKPTIIGSLSNQAKDLAVISPEFETLVPDGCPIMVKLDNEGYFDKEKEKKVNFFNTLS